MGGSSDRELEAWTAFKTMKFRNLITWNSIIAGFQKCGLGFRAIEVFSQMHREGIEFDGVTLLTVLSSLCEANGNIAIKLGLQVCFQLHCLAVKTGSSSDLGVATALIKACSSLGGEVMDCYGLFLETQGHRDIVLWTAIISVFAEHYPTEAFALFCQLCGEDLALDPHTFSVVLKACASFATQRHAGAIHSQIVKIGLEYDTVVRNALIHAYARCGGIALSEKVFNEMMFHNVVSWNTMLKAYALHGRAEKALQLFSQMTIEPDARTFVSLLAACSHAGMVEEGFRIFNSMHEKYGIAPLLDHYACMVDILGRAGRVVEAEELVRRMPIEPDSVVWSALLGASRKHSKTWLAKLAAAKLNELDPGNSLGYVQISNVYCSSGSFNEAGLIRKEMHRGRIRKQPGLSWIEIGNKIHEFTSGAPNHPERERIFTRLEGLVGQLKEKGYSPDTSLALHDVEEEQKEEQLYRHSEKLALIFALMNEGSLNSGDGIIKIMKNIRICLDCHNFMKLASDIVQKEIVIRDSNRFHHFKDGVCSCDDYW